MIGIENAYCDAAIRSLLLAYHNLLASFIDEAIQPTTIVGKVDTLGLDSIAEIAIADELTNFDQYAILVTEERGKDANPLGNLDSKAEKTPRTFFISDPTDRSSPLRKFLEKQGKATDKIADVLHTPCAAKLWEESFGAPASITGACSAITCIRRGTPIFSVILNYITHSIYVACSAGIYSMELSRNSLEKPEPNVNLNQIRSKGSQVFFPEIPYDEENCRRFVTFMGKELYKNNLRDSRLAREVDIEKYLHYSEPGGPTRVLYLSNMQPQSIPIGFVLANGEKIGEWVHWLPFVRFGNADTKSRESTLNIFEISHDRPWTRDGILMSTSPEYSIFTKPDPANNKFIINADRIKSFDNPSKYRSTLIVTHKNNYWLIGFLKQHGHRRIEFLGD